MQSYVEPALGNPLREDSEKAQSSHIDFGIQREPEQSPDKEDEGKTSWIKLLMKRVLESLFQNQVMADYFQRMTTRCNKRFLRTSTILLRNKAISKLMKCS